LRYVIVVQHEELPLVVSPAEIPIPLDQARLRLVVSPPPWTADRGVFLSVHGRRLTNQSCHRCSAARSHLFSTDCACISACPKGGCSGFSSSSPSLCGASAVFVRPTFGHNRNSQAQAFPCPSSVSKCSVSTGTRASFALPATPSGSNSCNHQVPGALASSERRLIEYFLLRNLSSS